MRTSSYGRFARRAFFFAGATGLAIGIDACSSGTSTPGEQQARLPAAIATGCVYPSTSAQTTALPAAGGVTGTISLAAFSENSNTCLTTTVATGGQAISASATTLARTRSTVRTTAGRRSFDAISTAPLLQVSLFDAFTGSATVTGVTLKTPGLPDGTYPATVTTDELGAIVVTNYTIVVKNGVATTGGGIFGSPIEPDGTSTLSIYPMGTVLPTPAPTVSASPGASAAPTAGPATPVPSVAPTLLPTIAPTATPTATPNPATFTASFAIVPAGCIHFTAAGGTQQYTITPSAPAPAGFSYLYGWSGIGASGIGQPQQTVYGAHDAAFVASPSNSATLTVGAISTNGGLVGSSGSVGAALFLQEPAGSPYYGQVREVSDSSGNPDQTYFAWTEGTTMCP